MWEYIIKIGGRYGCFSLDLLAAWKDNLFKNTTILLLGIVQKVRVFLFYWIDNRSKLKIYRARWIDYPNNSHMP